jgi:hypothetical protein
MFADAFILLSGVVLVLFVLDLKILFKWFEKQMYIKKRTPYLSVGRRPSC